MFRTVRPSRVSNIHQQIRCQSTLPPSIKSLFKNPPDIDSKLTINGYIKSIRQLKKIAFLDLSDGSHHDNLLCVLSPDQINGLKTGQSIQLTGSWIKSKGKEQAYEFKILSGLDNVKLIGDVREDFPLQKKAHTLQYLRTLNTLRWRTSYLSSILRFRSFVDTKLHEFFQKENFFKTNPPIITGSDCEGAGELFQIESKSVLDDSKDQSPFFGKNAYLTVSTQLHLEVMSAALGNVWTLSPIFRAEASDTNRHLSEFWMLEGEMPYVEDVHQITRFTEKMIKHVVKELVNDADQAGTNLIKGNKYSEEAGSKSMTLQEKWNLLYENEWASITYKESLEILRASGKEFKHLVKYEDGLATEHEKWLAGEYFKSPVFVTDYPKEMKPFYMKENPDGETVACFDLLVPEVGEIIGGSLREHDLEKLTSTINERNMKIDELKWYLSLRENSTAPHGGFGLGFERLICYLANVENVRDVVPFPRSHEECSS
ncbi:Asparaginyl-tRNA synthetase [Wickerhamomyces ciferrii]|uniref:Asparagine--tRNA ligase, mitochondrial n=1 Tax=Wickerhamomyces ciferrii (strain ATCC 14091 / BCRC 22168 / CBS 111 / JCM 3599 / NBRC 0793 / NRRL Y-1031 F-60-10) TaxID=1206466 RepID=K0KN18_WICCF|nr:Asparaginyl-tRNA synthetase [Wickerhamomyces ciferrii]CCH42523.1 Asparaginyl-tRNA synthetase [Wickerhamomyces ciferrii]